MAIVENALVSLHKGELITTSRKVAEIFERQHKNVLQSIEEILVAEKLAAKHFHKITYENRGKQYPEYLMNFDGFSILVMGFNGKKAIQFRVKFVEEFRRMREELDRINLNKQNAEWLETRKDVKVLYRKMTDSLKVLVDYATAAGSKNADKLYITYSKLINKNLGLKPGQRDSLTIWQLHEIEKMQSMIETIVKGLIAKGTEYHQIYKDTKQMIESYSALAYFNGTHAALRSA